MWIWTTHSTIRGSVVCKMPPLRKCLISPISDYPFRHATPSNLCLWGLYRVNQHLPFDCLCDHVPALNVDWGFSVFLRTIVFCPQPWRIFMSLLTVAVLSVCQSVWLVTECQRIDIISLFHITTYALWQVGFYSLCWLILEMPTKTKQAYHKAGYQLLPIPLLSALYRWLLLHQAFLG